MREFYVYLKERKLLVIFSALLISIIYGYRILKPAIGIDTEMALASYDTTINWYIGCGRFVCALFRKIIMPFHFNYYLAFVLVIIFLTMTLLILMYAFYRYGLTNIASSVLFSSLFFTFPTLAELFYFSVQCDVMSIAFFLTTIASVLVCNHIFFDGRLLHLFVGIIMGVLSTGSYQAFLYLFISETLVFSILKVYFSEDTESFHQYLIYAIKLIISILSIVFIYFLTSNVISDYFYNPGLEYAGYLNAENYISSSIVWGTDTFTQCLSNIVSYIFETIEVRNPFGSFGFALIFIVSLFLVLLSAIKEKNIKSIYVFLLLIALGITPYLGAIVKGQHILLREQFILPFVFAFLSAFLYHILSNMCIVKILLISALLVTSSCQTLTTLELFKTDYLRYRYDCTTVQEITETAIQNYGPLEDKIMVYSGFKTWRFLKICSTETASGIQFFNGMLIPNGGQTIELIIFLNA